MQRVTRSTAVAVLPAIPASPGAPGYFTGGTPGVTPSTVPGFEWFNGVQEEMIAILAAAGITPDASNLAQLLAALNILYKPGRLIGVQRFTAGGTYTPAAGMATAIVEVQGGGAAGGGVTLPAAGNVSLGAPGGAGAYGRGRFTAASIGASQVVTVGAGGAGIAGANGSAGGTSSLGSLLSAVGGVAGGGLNNQAAPSVNGNGAVTAAPAGATIAGVVGGSQAVTLALSAAIGYAGGGGTSQFGLGGYSIGLNVNGIDAVNFGSGGGGCIVNNGGGGSYRGGNGAPGLVVVMEYA